MDAETASTAGSSSALQPFGEIVRWFAPGQELQVQIGDQIVTVRFVGRKGRRARIAITATANATFQDAR